MKAIVAWLMGVPILVIVLLYAFGFLGRSTECLREMVRAGKSPPFVPKVLCLDAYIRPVSTKISTMIAITPITPTPPWPKP